MTTALWCLFVAALLPVVCAGISKWGFKNFDNRRPREWLAKQDGWRARANSAQANSWEALIVFAAGVLTAHVAGAAQPTVDALAIAFIVARVLYIYLYVSDRATFRSFAWFASYGISLAMFFLAI
jgi:uncharacterized MAPEG superfamily protein